MEIKKTIFVRQCDIRGCGNYAEYVIKKDPEDSRTQLFLCDECLCEINKCFNRIKNKKAPIKNIEK